MIMEVDEEQLTEPMIQVTYLLLTLHYINNVNFFDVYFKEWTIISSLLGLNLASVVLCCIHRYMIFKKTLKIVSVLIK